jgi:hypothetical protein
LRPAKFIILAVLFLGLPGCAKRQTAVHLIYVPAPPTASAATAQGGTLVIQKPAPAEPAVAKPKQQPVPEPPPEIPQRASQHVARREAPAAHVSTAQRPAADAPRLEEATSLQQQAHIEQNVNTLQRALEARINRLSRLNLAGADRKALEDARTFVTQSQDALKNGDLSQSSNLAEKANLLVQAVEKRY